MSSATNMTGRALVRKINQGKKIIKDFCIICS